MNYKVKIIVGFRKDQEYSIDADEAHKAYFLFLNPTQRGVFKNGLAIIGSHIQEIVPDYQGTMGWNPAHVLGPDDWKQIQEKGVDRKLRDVLYQAKEVAVTGNSTLINQPLTKLLSSNSHASLLE